MPLNIIRNDITRVSADAIVNTANPRVAVGRGTDNAIYEAAGREQLLAERAKIGNIEPGHAAYTPAFALGAKYVIHTVGPAWRGGDHHERETVALCYRNSLRIADELGCESVAFPLISTGTYGFPKDEALRIAVDEISGFLFTHDMTVYLVVYDKEAFDISGRAFADVRSYIDESEVKPPVRDRRSRFLQGAGKLRERESLNMPFGGRYSDPVGSRYSEAECVTEDFQEKSASVSYREVTLEDILSRKGETFQEMLFRIIDRKGLKDPEVYRKSNIDRKLFSKIRNEDYNPSKRTVMALAVGLELNIDEATDLMQRAGYSFAPGNLADLTVRTFIEQKMYDINLINCFLFDLDCKTLGA